VAAGVGFGRFNYLVLAAGVVLVVAGLGQASLLGFCRRRTWVRAALVSIAWCIAAWLTFAVFPHMVDARQQGDRAAVDNLHHVYSGAYWAQMILLMTAVALTGWMQLDRKTSIAN
jgi:hypothetical protein